jgi:hypothetical protein
MDRSTPRPSSRASPQLRPRPDAAHQTRSSDNVLASLASASWVALDFELSVQFPYGPKPYS